MSNPIIQISQWFESLLLGWGLADSLVLVLMQAIGAFAVIMVGFTTVIALIWFERKLAARLQDRIGPNRAGPYGLLQPIADIIKMFTKEDTTPASADKVPFNIAPVLSVASVLFIWAVIPFTAAVVGTDINVGVLYIVAVGSFGIVAALMAGWSSNNKFALLGAYRAVAQMVAYEIPMVLVLLIPVLLARSMNLSDIVNAQSTWFIVIAPLAALIFLISSMAEVGRAPFDLIEAESEIVAGFHTEYSGMKFGMFYVGEFLHVWTVGALISVLFLGGWRVPWVDIHPLWGIVSFYVKTFFGYFVISWIRLTVPRIRIDQMLAFNWKFLTPLALVVLMVTAILDKTLELAEVTGWGYGLAMLSANLVIGWMTIEILKKVEPRKKRQEFPHRPVAVAPKITDN